MAGELPSKRVEVLNFAGPEALAGAAAKGWVDGLATMKSADRVYSVALSGGRIAARFFSAVVNSAGAERIAALPVHFFWADERCVSPENPESNFRLADERLLRPLKIPAEHVHRVRGELEPETAAAAVEAEMRRCTGSALGTPVLDCVFLGMGEDGHVASLFPGEPDSIRGGSAVYRAVTSPKPPPRRVTLGYGTIAAAREVVVLVSGPGKEPALRDALAGNPNSPLARVLELRSQTRILTEM